MRTFLLGFLALFFASVGTSFGQASLRAGDTIEIRLSGVPDEDARQFSGSYAIDDKNLLNLPFLEAPVKAGGLLPNQVQSAIESRLKAEKIYTRPTITIISQVTSRFVNVAGAVRAPQRIAYTPDLTLMSAINAAGDFNEFANPNKVRLIREGKASVHDVRKIRKDPGLDPRLQPGDQIQVPQGMF